MNNNLDKINMKWHGSTIGILKGGKIQEGIDELHKEYNVPKDYQRVFLSKEGRTQEEKDIFHFLQAVALKMYEGAQQCEEEVVISKDEDIEKLQEENERLREEN
jgi:hypothetical protein